MLSFKTFVISFLPVVVTANPLLSTRGNAPCNTGALQCCEQTNMITSGNNAFNTMLAGLIGIPIGSLVGVVAGVQCTPINVVSVGHSTCSQTTVCCTNNTYSGNGVALGCTPVSL